MREAFRITERVAIADVVAAKLAQRHGGDRKTVQAGNISGLKSEGDTRDLAAAKAGFLLSGAGLDS